MSYEPGVFWKCHIKKKSAIRNFEIIEEHETK
jgi:hypothetical protein